MNDGAVELTAKLKLDTSEATQKLKDVSKSATGAKAPEVKLPDNVTKGIGGIFKKDGGLGGVAKIAQGAAAGVNGLVGAIGNIGSAAGGAAAGVVGLVLAIVALVVKIMQGTNTWELIKAQFEALAETLQRVLGPAIALIGEVVLVIIDALKSLEPLFKIVGNLLEMLLAPIVGILQVLSPVFELLGALLSVSEALGSIFTETSVALMTSLFSILSEIVSAVLQPLIDMLMLFVDAIDSAKVAIQDWIEKVTGGLINFDDSLARTSGAKARESLKSSLDKWETSGQETATEKAARLAQEAAEAAALACGETQKSTLSLGESFKSIASDLGAGLSAVWAGISQGASSLWESISGFANTAWASVKGTAESVWSSVKGTAESVWTSIEGTAESVWASAKGAAESVWTSIEGTAESVWASAKGAAESVWTSIKETAESVWSSIKGTAEAVWEGIKKFFAPVANLADDAWSGVKGVADDVGSAIDKVGGFIAKGASAVWEGVSGFFGGLFGHAEGGTLDVGAQVWGMNEQGNPEFMFNAGGRDTVVNADILANAVYEGVRRAVATSQNRDKLEISVKEGVASGPRELAQWLLPSLKFLLGK